MSDAPTRPPGPVAVIGAMAEEVERLRARLEGALPVVTHPFRVDRGVIAGVEVLVAECGVGKVNAAALMQLLITTGATRCVFTGVAGGVAPDLRVGDVVIGREAVQHDVDVTALGYEPGQVPGSPTRWHADPALVRVAVDAAEEVAAAGGAPFRVEVGTIASGDQFVSSPERTARLRELFDAACTEMEGAACAQVCAAWDVPFVIVRSISDTADHSAHVDFRSFTRLAAERADRIVTGMLARLAPQPSSAVPGAHRG